MDRDGFIVGVPCAGKYTEVLNSDAVEFGGKGRVNATPIKATNEPWDGKENSISIHLPPLSTVVFEYNYKEPVKKVAAKSTVRKTGTTKRSTTKKTDK